MRSSDCGGKRKSSARFFRMPRGQHKILQGLYKLKRGAVIRWKKKPENYLSTLKIACALIGFRRDAKSPVRHFETDSMSRYVLMLHRLNPDRIEFGMTGLYEQADSAAWFQCGGFGSDCLAACHRADSAVTDGQG